MKWISILIWSLFWTAMLFSQGNVQSSNETFKVAFSAYEQGNYDLAIKSYTAAITADPNRNYFYYNRGMTYLAVDKTDLAMADFKHANELKPTAEAYYQQGVIEYNNGAMVTAKTDLEKARALRKDVEHMNYLLGMIYYKYKEYAHGVECLQDYTRNIQTNADAFYYKALCEAKTGNIDAATASIKFVKFNKGSDPKYFYKIYELYTATGDRQNALNYLNQLIETATLKPDYYKERAALYHAMGQEDQSKEDIQTAKRLQGLAASE